MNGTSVLTMAINRNGVCGGQTKAEATNGCFHRMALLALLEFARDALLHYYEGTIYYNRA